MARRSANGTLKVSDEVLDVVSRLRVDGDLVPRHGETLARPVYLALDEVLSALGGKWSRSRSGHTFPAGVDVAALLEAVVLTGTCKDPRAGDFFETPTKVADLLVERAEVPKGAFVLEPSAGRGAIAVRVNDRHPDALVQVVELDPERAEYLRNLKFFPRRGEDHLRSLCVWQEDFLLMKPSRLGNLHDLPHRVLMNPPFGRQQDLAHVTHALTFLRPGGRLVSVMSAGAKFRTDRKATEFRALVQGKYGGTFESLPDGSFAESGTDVRAVVLVVNVPR